VDPQAIDERFRIAQQIMGDAVSCALGHYRDPATLAVEMKGPQDLVSKEDRATEALIRSAVGEAFPADGFVGEESGSDPAGDGIWVVDSIDGNGARKGA